MQKRSTGKRLFQYAMLYKRQISIALLLLVLAISAELAGPFIAKRMIDQNILGIEKAWIEVPEERTYAVSYDGRWYIREDRLGEAEVDAGAGAEGDASANAGAEAAAGSEASAGTGAELAAANKAHLLQSGRHFYWLNDASGFEDGLREVSSGPQGYVMAIENRETGAVKEYPAERLTAAELFSFYKPEFPSILRLAAFYFGLLLLAAAFTYGQRIMLQTSANGVVRVIRNDAFAHTQRLPVRYYDNLAAGKVVSRITNDTESIRDLYVSVLANFFTGIIYMAAIYVALFLLNVKLALISLTLVPILIAWIIIYRRFAARYNRIIRSKLSEINGMINESIQGMSIIKAFRREKEITNEFEELNESYFTYQNKLLNLNSLTSHNLLNTIRTMLFLVVIWMFWGGQLGAAISVGVLYAYIDYMGRMFGPIVGIVNQLSNLETALVSAERVFVLMDEEGVDVTDGSMERYRGEVKFDNVYFAYKQNEYVIKGVSFEAKQGETVALVGHTGSGKSSILNLLFRFYDTDEGKIMIDGKDVRDIPKQHLRQHMGIVLQDPFLFTGTIASNISLDNPAISREKIEQALKDVGAYDMFSALPGGIDAPVIEKGSTLSAGQRQLISFARALAYNPAILILDEATASIDTETEAIIQEALDVLKKGRTTFVIAHRLSTIRAANQILVLDHGRIVERGDHDDLMAKQGKYYAMYQLQQGAVLAPQV